jgi:hypothetical protein
MDVREVYRFFVTLTPGQFLLKCLIWVVQRVIFFKIFRIINLPLADVDPVYLDEAPGFDGRFLDRESCRKLSIDPIYDLSKTFLDRSLGNDDKCYALIQNDVVASYSWFSDKPGIIVDRLQFHYDKSYFYGTWGFTLPRFRGRHLYAFGVAAGLKDYGERGYRGLIGIVEAQNYNAVRSNFRVGYTAFGTIFVIRLFGRYFIRASKGCEKHSCSMTVLEG